MATLIPDVYQVQLPPDVDEVLQIFRVSIEIDAWNVHMSCYGLSYGIISQLGFLILWPLILIVFTPVVGLALSLILKQTTLRQLSALGLARGKGGFVDTVFLGYVVPLTMLVLFLAFPPVTSLATQLVEGPAWRPS